MWVWMAVMSRTFRASGGPPSSSQCYGACLNAPEVPYLNTCNLHLFPPPRFLNRTVTERFGLNL